MTKNKQTLLLDYSTIATLHQYLNDIPSHNEQQLLGTINHIKHIIQDSPFLREYYNNQLNSFETQVKGNAEIKRLLSKIQKNYELDNKSLDINLLGSSDIEKELPAIEKTAYFYYPIQESLSPLPFIDGSAMITTGSSSLCKFLCDVLTLYIIKSHNWNTICKNESYSDTGYHDFKQYCPGYLYDFYIFDSEDKLLNFGYFATEYLMSIFKIATANVLRCLISELKNNLIKTSVKLDYDETNDSFTINKKPFILTDNEKDALKKIGGFAKVEQNIDLRKYSSEINKKAKLYFNTTICQRIGTGKYGLNNHVIS